MGRAAQGQKVGGGGGEAMAEVELGWRLIWGGL
jgi:hypothetical protein